MKLLKFSVSFAVLENCISDKDLKDWYLFWKIQPHGKRREKWSMGWRQDVKKYVTSAAPAPLWAAERQSWVLCASPEHRSPAKTPVWGSCVPRAAPWVVEHGCLLVPLDYCSPCGELTLQLQVTSFCSAYGTCRCQIPSCVCCTWWTSWSSPVA